MNLEQAKESNPAGDDACGAGNHAEKIYYPDVPKSEWDPKKRVAKLKELAKNDQDLFEAKAAEHNVNAGTIDHGRQISRNISDEERDSGADADSQKVWAICQVCGYRREIDHSANKNSSVEAKSSEDAMKGSKQKVNNEKRVKQGNSVTYKSPPLPNKRYKDYIDRGFNVIILG